MFSYWKEMNGIMWKSSKSVKMGVDDPSAINTKTLVLASGSKTEFYDYESDTWQKASICQMGNDWRGIKGGQWIWVRDTVTKEEAITGTKKKLRLKFNLPSESADSIRTAEMLLRSEDACHISVNDVRLVQEYGGAEYPDPFLIDIDQYVQLGDNTITFDLVSYANPDSKVPEDNLVGLIYRLHVEYS